MKNLGQRASDNKHKDAGGRSRGSASGLIFEPLEQRRLLSAELLVNGTLVVLGTNGDDEILVDGFAPGVVRVVEDFQDPTIETFEGVRHIVVRGKKGNDTIEGTGSRIRADGGDIGLEIYGQLGHDVIRADGESLLVGGPGGDLLEGFAINEGHNESVTMFGNRGADVLIGHHGDDELNGGKGPDQIYGMGGFDTLIGRLGRDIMRGGAGNDVLFGGAQADDMFGGAGTDELRGASGSDIYRGEFGEWVNFRQSDQFFSPLFDTDPSSVALSGEFWSQIDEIDAEFGPDLPLAAWGAIDGLQHIFAQASSEIDAFEQALGNLGEDDRRNLAIDVSNVLRQFTFPIEDPSVIDGASVEALLADMSAVMPFLIRQSFGDIVDRIVEDPARLDSVVRGVRALSDKGVPKAFRDVVEVFLFGFA